jgi:hypothetical protein
MRWWQNLDVLDWATRACSRDGAAVDDGILVVAAYWRDDALEKRRPMMEVWDRFSMPKAGKASPRRPSSPTIRYLTGPFPRHLTAH